MDLTLFYNQLSQNHELQELLKKNKVSLDELINIFIENVESELEQINNYEEQINSLRRKNESSKIKILQLEKDLEKEKRDKREKEIKIDSLNRDLNSIMYNEQFLFNHYVFGDNLPELKKIYLFLKKHEIYNSSWGFFCHNIQKKTKTILELHLNKEFTLTDLGYLLFNFKKVYDNENATFKFWVLNNVKIFKSTKKEIDLNYFAEKYIRDYSYANYGPRYGHEIRSLFNKLYGI